MSKKCKGCKDCGCKKGEIQRKHVNLLDSKDYTFENLVNRILLMMLKSGAKSVQFIETTYELFFIFPDGKNLRVETNFYDIKERFSKIVSRLKFLSGLKVGINNIVQRGVLKFRHLNEDHHFLLTVLPSFILGESAIIDIIHPPKEKKCKRCRAVPCHC